MVHLKITLKWNISNLHVFGFHVSFRGSKWFLYLCSPHPHWRPFGWPWHTHAPPGRSWKWWVLHATSHPAASTTLVPAAAVDGRNPTPVEVGSFSHLFTRVYDKYIPGGCFGFLPSTVYLKKLKANYPLWNRSFWDNRLMGLSIFIPPTPKR